MKKIKTIFVVFILLLTIILSIGCKSQEHDIEYYFNSVLKIVCSSEDRFDSVGTGFKANDGYVYTNAHIVVYQNLQDIYHYESIKGTVYNSNDIIEMKIVAIDYVKDIAVLLPNAESATYNDIMGLEFADSNQLEIGKNIYTIGNINGYGLAYSNGTISSNQKIIERNNNENLYIQTNIEISKGSSGGPVLNEKNKVIGMMTFKLRDVNYEYVDGMSFAIPSNIITAAFPNILV